MLKNAKDEPVIADPEIQGGIAIEPSFQFLLMFSRSLTDCLSQIGSCEGDLVQELCRITYDSFVENTTVTGVAQSVVDQIVRRHREQFEIDENDYASNSNSAVAYRTREDMTLLVRNFNAKLKRKRSANSSNHHSHHKVATNSSTVVMNNVVFAEGGRADTHTTATASTTMTSKHQPTHSSSTTTASSDAFGKGVRDLPVDEDGCIQPYVDFAFFNNEWSKYKQTLSHNN